MAWSLTDDVSTVLAWWDGSDGSTITTDGSGGIDQVDDKSGNEHHLDNLGNSTNKLTVQAAEINGLNTLKNQTSNCGIYTSNTPINARAILGVWKWYDGSSYDHPFTSAGYYHGRVGSGLNGACFQSLGSRYGYDSDLRVNGEASGTGASLTRSSTPEMFAMEIQPSDSDDNHFLGLGYPTTSLGSRSPGVYYAEIVCLESGYTQSDLEIVEGYLAWKWGLEGDLPAAHPYKDAAPEPAVPNITEQPQDASVVEGGPDALFSVTAEALEGDLSYQWHDASDDSEIAGATSSSLSVAALSSNDGNQYYVNVTDDGGTAQSNTATLSVVAPLVTTTTLANKKVSEGETVEYSMSATGGSAPLSYQWYKDGSPISGETSSDLSFTAEAEDDQSEYFCRVSDSGSLTADSNTSTLSVILELSIDTQPQAASVSVEEIATFTAEISGNLPLRAQWYGPGGKVDGLVLLAGTVTSLNVPALPSSAGGYYVEITDAEGQKEISDTASLTVTVPAPQIVMQPQDINSSAGSSYTLEVSAVGFGGLLYRWHLDGVEVPGGRPRLTVAPGNLASEAYVIVENGYGGSVQSDTATITLYDVGVVDNTAQPTQFAKAKQAPSRYTNRDWASMVAAVEPQHVEVEDYIFSGRRFVRRDKLLNPKK